MSRLLVFATAFATVLGAAGPAQAYLDPGTGSMLLQVLLGGIAGAFVVAKLYWKRLKGFFDGTSNDDPGSENEPVDR
jgi:hypothetical protein